MTTAITPIKQDIGAALEAVLIQGDLNKLTPDQRIDYYKRVCDSVGLNPLTRPFDYITLQGKLTLYAKKDATDQLRKIHNISITSLERETIEGVYVVIAHAMTPQGRQDTSSGAVNIKGLTGDALANALMKAETKSKRRATLSICGLSVLDETELETIPTTFSQAQPDILTDKQLRAIYAIGRAERRLSEQQVDDRCAEIFGYRANELTKAEASQFLDMLKVEGFSQTPAIQTVTPTPTPEPADPEVITDAEVRNAMLETMRDHIKGLPGITEQLYGTLARALIGNRKRDAVPTNDLIAANNTVGKWETLADAQAWLDSQKPAQEPAEASIFTPEDTSKPQASSLPGKSSVPAGGAPSTEKQQNAILAIGKATRNWTADEAKQAVADRYGCSLQLLSSAQADEFLGWLKGGK